MDGVVLVLNQSYEPLNVCNLPRAFRLVFGQKAEVVEYDHQMIRTPRQEYRAPSVIRLQHQIRRPRPRVKLTRREVFARDGYACQYCTHRKGGKFLDEAKLRLAHRPVEPRCDLYSLFTPYLRDDRNENWRSYLFLGHSTPDGAA